LDDFEKKKSKKRLLFAFLKNIKANAFFAFFCFFFLKSILFKAEIDL
jgi:hypothetical protein